jgi:hypothetical protein
MYFPRAMLTSNRVMLKAGAFIARPATVAVLPGRFVTASIIKTWKAALVWRACEQSERK